MNAYRIILEREMKPNEFIVIAENMSRAENVYRTTNRYDTIKMIELIQQDVLLDLDKILLESTKNKSNGNNISFQEESTKL